MGFGASALVQWRLTRPPISPTRSRPGTRCASERRRGTCWRDRVSRAGVRHGVPTSGLVRGDAGGLGEVIQAQAHDLAAQYGVRRGRVQRILARIVEEYAG